MNLRMWHYLFNLGWAGGLGWGVGGGFSNTGVEGLGGRRGVGVGVGVREWGNNSFQKLESMGCAVFLFGRRVQSAAEQEESNVIYDIYSCLILMQNHKNKRFVS